MFARDVGVNVVANLFSVAVIYLAGVVTGLLPRSGLLAAGSLATVFCGLTIATGLWVVGGNPRTTAYASLASLAFGVFGLAFILLDSTVSAAFRLACTAPGLLIMFFLARTTVACLKTVSRVRRHRRISTRRMAGNRPGGR